MIRLHLFVFQWTSSLRREGPRPQTLITSHSPLHRAQFLYLTLTSKSYPILTLVSSKNGSSSLQLMLACSLYIYTFCYAGNGSKRLSKSHSCCSSLGVHVARSVESLVRLHKKIKTLDAVLDDRGDLSTTRVAWNEVRDNVERGPCQFRLRGHLLTSLETHHRGPD